MVVTQTENQVWGVFGSVNTLRFAPLFGGDVQSMMCSIYGTHYIRSDGNAYFVGRDNFGESGTSSGTSGSNILNHTLVMSNVNHINARYQNTWWFLKTGEVYWSGRNNEGQAGNGTTSVVSVDKPTLNTLLIIPLVSGTFICPSSLTNSGGTAPICIFPSEIRNGGVNDNGQIGNNTTTLASSWVTMSMDNVGTYDDIKCVSKDTYSSMVVTTDNKLYACGGRNSSGYRLPNGAINIKTLSLMANMPWY